MLSNLTPPGPRITFLLALALACDGSTGNHGLNDEPSSSQQHAGPIAPGTWGRATHFQMRVSIPEQCAQLFDGELGAHWRRISVEVALKASGGVQVPGNPYYALLVDRSDTVYEATLGKCNDSLTPSLLQPGQAAHGWLTFDVPLKSAGHRLVYAPALIGAPREELVFELGPD